MKGLLLAAIEDEDPVIFMEHKLLFNDVGEVPDEYYTIRFGEAAMLPHCVDPRPPEGVSDARSRRERRCDPGGAFMMA